MPKVTDADVERIALREFGPDRVSQALAILAEYGRQEWNRPGSARVRLAVLKLADGDLAKLSAHTKVAIQDFRDVLTAAEYPRFSTDIGFEKVARQKEEAAIQDDWRQYKEWFERK